MSQAEARPEAANTTLNPTPLPHAAAVSSLQTRPGVPVFLKKRNLLELNEIETYLKQLGTRVARSGKRGA